MTRTVLEHQVFTDLRDAAPVLIEGYELRRCAFDRCVLSRTLDASRRSTVRDVVLLTCEVQRASIGGVILEDVVIDGLKTQGLLQLWGPAFRHVVLRGRIGRIMVSPFVAPATATDAQQRAYERANTAFYALTDWGIDVQEAEADELDFGGVPGRMIRFDPRDGALVTREAARRGAWRQVDLSGTWWDIAIEQLIKYGFDSAALVAPRRHRQYKRLVEGIRRLRDVGVAEPT
jgi:hypothetical protein